MKVYRTTTNVDLISETGDIVEFLFRGEIVEEIEDRDDKVLVRLESAPETTGLLPKDKLRLDPDLTVFVRPAMNVPRFIEATHDAAAQIGERFAGDPVQLSARTLLLFSWVVSAWQNQGEDIPPPSGNQPNTPFGPFGFRPGPWQDALSDPKYADMLGDMRPGNRINPLDQCYVAACRLNSLQNTLHGVTGQSPPLFLLRIADILGAAEVQRFVQLAATDKVDKVIAGAPALSPETLAEHGALFVDNGTARTRREVETMLADRLDAAATEAADAAAVFLKTLDPPAAGTADVGGPKVMIDDTGLEILSRIAAAEAGIFHIFGDNELKKGLTAVVDTVINRVAHPNPFFGDGIEGVVEKKSQFQPITMTADKRWQQLDPATAKEANIVRNHIVGRTRDGRASKIKGATHFLNPTTSDPAELARWGNHVVKNATLKVGEAPTVHFHGIPPKENPPPAHSIVFNGNESFFSGEGLPLAPPAEADASTRALIASALKEWNHFGKSTVSRVVHTEREDDFARYILETYVPIGGAATTLSQIKNNQFHWSAVCISFILKQAGVEKSAFKFSASHSVYIREAVRSLAGRDATKLYWAYRIGDAEAMPQPGDIVCNARGQGLTPAQALTFYDKTSRYNSHADLVVERRGNEIDVIGGNVSQSVTKKTITLRPDGKLPTDKLYFAVMKKQR